MEKKTLEQLADEYLNVIDALNEQIEKCREELLQAQKTRHNFTVTDLTRKLTVLYDQRNELRETQAHLRNYYKPEMRCAG